MKDATETLYYSQFGEDRLLAAIFKDVERGVCVEVGANDGYHGSTTLHFERRGWECVLVEPNPALCERLRSERTAQVFECAVSSQNGSAVLQVAEGADLAHALSSISDLPETKRTVRRHGFTTRGLEVTTRRLDDILDEAKLTRIDFITIDVEGHELSALSGFSLERWLPTIVIVEDNGFFGDRSVQRHLRNASYVPFHRTGVNDWYAHSTNSELTDWAREWAYFRAQLGGRYFLVRHNLAQRVKKVPGADRLYRALRRIVRSDR